MIERNTVMGNRQAGILLAGTAGVQVARNTVHANAGPGIWLFDGATANEVLGAIPSPQTAQGSRSPSGARPTASRTTRCPAALRRASGWPRPGTATCVAGNLVALSGEDGIRLAESPAARVERNSVHDSRRDGIFVNADRRSVGREHGQPQR